MSILLLKTRRQHKMYVMNLEWTDSLGERHIVWNVADPEQMKRNLIALNVPAENIEIYEKDVS